MNIVGLNIKNRRIELGMTQEELAKRMGLKSKVSICDVERGKGDLTTDRVRKFADALSCSPASLMGWTDNQVDRLKTYHDLILKAYNEASEKDKKAVCAILEIPYQD